MVDRSPQGIMRRVAGSHDNRLEGVGDLCCIGRAFGKTVFDVACNRGMVGFEFARNGAALVHGCDMDPECISVAKQVHADMRAHESWFETVDLLGGPSAIKAAFDKRYLNQYDFFLAFGIWHKLERVMTPEDLETLFVHFAKKAKEFFIWRGGKELEVIKGYCEKAGGLKLVQWSELSEIGPIAVWQRK